MSNKVVLVTPPDDLSEDALRITLVGLTQVQSQILSDALNRIENIPSIILYIWNPIDPLNWLFDKKIKSNLIIFNTELPNELLIGYLAAQPNSYYFGILKTLDTINSRAIYDIDQCVGLLENNIRKYEQKFK